MRCRTRYCWPEPGLRAPRASSEILLRRLRPQERRDPSRGQLEPSREGRDRDTLAMEAAQLSVSPQSLRTRQLRLPGRPVSSSRELRLDAPSKRSACSTDDLPHRLGGDAELSADVLERDAAFPRRRMVALRCSRSARGRGQGRWWRFRPRTARCTALMLRRVLRAMSVRRTPAR